GAGGLAAGGGAGRPVLRAGAAVVAVGGLRGAGGVPVLDEGEAGEGGGGGPADVPQRAVLVSGIDGRQLGIVQDRPPPGAGDDVGSDALRLRRLRWQSVAVGVVAVDQAVVQVGLERCTAAV